MQVSVAELKNHLSQYLHKVQAGVKVVVTSHRVPLAVINGISPKEKTELSKIYQFEDIEWNGKKPKGMKNAPKVRGKTAAEMLLEDRR